MAIFLHIPPRRGPPKWWKSYFCLKSKVVGDSHHYTHPRQTIYMYWPGQRFKCVWNVFPTDPSSLKSEIAPRFMPFSHNFDLNFTGNHIPLKPSLHTIYQSFHNWSYSFHPKYWAAQRWIKKVMVIMLPLPPSFQNRGRGVNISKLVAHLSKPILHFVIKAPNLAHM